MNSSAVRANAFKILSAIIFSMPAIDGISPKFSIWIFHWNDIYIYSWIWWQLIKHLKFAWFNWRRLMRKSSAFRRVASYIGLNFDNFTSERLRGSNISSRKIYISTRLPDWYTFRLPEQCRTAINNPGDFRNQS